MTVRPVIPQDVQNVEEFLNTTDERTFSRHGTAHTGGELLMSPGALWAWLADHALATSDTQITEAELTAALALRTTLRESMIKAGEAPRSEAVQAADAVFAGFPLQLVLGPTGSLRLSAVTSGPLSALSPIVETVVHCVVQGSWKRLKICAAPDCQWVFYDASRSGAGRWCSMATCGNRQKTRKYRERQQQTACDRRA